MILNIENFDYNNLFFYYGHLIIDDTSLGIPLVEPENERPYVDWVKVRKLLIDKNILDE